MAGSGSIPFIYASIIAPVPDLIADHGGNMDRAFRMAGVPVELASQPERIIPMRDYLTLLEEAARETGDEHFGVSMAERLEVSDLGPFGRLIAGAPTLRRAIETCCALIHNYSPALRCWLAFEDNTARWHYKITGISDCREGRRLDCEQTLLLFCTLIRLATGPNWQPSEILLEQATPRQLRALQCRYGAPVRCGGEYALVFARDLLDLPMTYGHSLGEDEQQALVTELFSSGPETSFVGSVKAIVRSQLCGGYPEISAVARSTRLSPRTFQRRLAEDGIAYSDLVAEVRRDLAQELLADSSRSQLDVSLSLGYSDAANFSRAFKHWTGETPRAFRRSLEHSPTAA